MYFLVAGLGIIGAGLAWLFRPLLTRKLAILTADPVAEYEAALERYQNGTANQEGPEILAPCHSILMGHGRKTERVIVFLHGLTNCPQQFNKLGTMYFEQGYNVLIPRMPLHGSVDRMNGNLTQITAEQLQTFTEEVYNISRGLGEKITVVGLSGGGVLACWLAQFCSEIELTVIMSPSLGLYRSNPLINRPVTKMLLRLPNIYNLRTPENLKIAPPYVQIKNSSHAAAQFFRLGISVFQAASKNPPACKNIVVVTNASDIIVNNALVKRMAELWQARSKGRVKTYEFALTEKLPHDFIDPNFKTDNSGRVYPILTGLIEEALDEGVKLNTKA